MLADALTLDIDLVRDTDWNASTALTSLQGKRKRMIENNESGDEYIIGTVILAQDKKLARQRRRIAQLEAAILQLRENAVLAYDRMIADDL